MYKASPLHVPQPIKSFVLLITTPVNFLSSIGLMKIFQLLGIDITCFRMFLYGCIYKICYNEEYIKADKIEYFKSNVNRNL